MGTFLKQLGFMNLKGMSNYFMRLLVLYVTYGTYNKVSAVHLLTRFCTLENMTQIRLRDAINTL